MAHYMFLNDVDAQRWTLMGIVVKMAQSVCIYTILPAHRVID